MKITPEIAADALSLLEAATNAVDTFADRRRLILGAGDRSTLAASVVIALAHRSTAAAPEPVAPHVSPSPSFGSRSSASQRPPRLRNTSAGYRAHFGKPASGGPRLPRTVTRCGSWKRPQKRI